MIRRGYVPDGWTPKTWRDRLFYVATRCEADHPDVAADYRAWAASIKVPIERDFRVRR